MKFFPVNHLHYFNPQVCFKMMDETQISKIVTTNEAGKALKELRKIYCYHYRRWDFRTLKKIYKKAGYLFSGKFNGYQQCNTEYHNFNHTIEVLQASARLLDGYNLKNRPLPHFLAKNLYIAAMFHDCGYIQEEWDIEGTGAKYSSSHVNRSITFIKRHYQKLGIDFSSIQSISNLILCTRKDENFDDIPFNSYEEKVTGGILATADLLGQMSNRQYLEKLLFLYYELKEARNPNYVSEFDMLRKTADFYLMVRERFSTTLMNIHTYALEHFKVRYGIPRNLYIEAIDRQISYLKRIKSDSNSNFPSKLKRDTRLYILQGGRE